MGLIKEYSFKYKGQDYELTEKWLSPEEDYLLPGMTLEPSINAV
jgi:hypothetical protein